VLSACFVPRVTTCRGTVSAPQRRSPIHHRDLNPSIIAVAPAAFPARKSGRVTALPNCDSETRSQTVCCVDLSGRPQPAMADTASAPSLLACLQKPRAAAKRPAAKPLPPARRVKSPREEAGLGRLQATRPPPAQADAASSAPHAAAADVLLPAHQFYGRQPSQAPDQPHPPSHSSSTTTTPLRPAAAATPAAAADWARSDWPIHRFPLQQKAFDFTDAHPQGQHLRVFAQEASTDGRRSFLVTTPASFWRHYLQVRAAPAPALARLHQRTRAADAAAPIPAPLQPARNRNAGRALLARPSLSNPLCPRPLTPSPPAPWPGLRAAAPLLRDHPPGQPLPPLLRPGVPEGAQPGWVGGWVRGCAGSEERPAAPGRWLAAARRLACRRCTPASDQR
jgi:hypothetical protein